LLFGLQRSRKLEHELDSFFPERALHAAFRTALIWVKSSIDPGQKMSSASLPADHEDEIVILRIFGEGSARD